jgi:hypothetical protein
MDSFVFEQNFAVFFMFTSLVLLTWAKLIGRQRFKLIFVSFFNNRFTQQIEREEEVGSSRMVIILQNLFFISVVLFFIKISKTFNLIYNDAHLYVAFFKIWLGIIGLYFFKNLIFRLLGFVFQEHTLAKEMNLIELLFVSVLGVVLFPINLILYFGNTISNEKIIFLVYFLFLILFIYKLLKIFLISFSQFSISLFHIFLYICTLEILPLIVLIKFLIG